MCTSFLASLLARAGQGTVAAHTYTHVETYTSADKIKTAAESECNNGLGFFEGTLFSIVWNSGSAIEYSCFD